MLNTNISPAPPICGVVPSQALVDTVVHPEVQMWLRVGLPVAAIGAGPWWTVVVV